MYSIIIQLFCLKGINKLYFWTVRFGFLYYIHVKCQVHRKLHTCVHQTNYIVMYINNSSEI